MSREREEFSIAELNDAGPLPCPAALLAKLQSAFFNAYGESLYVCPTLDPEDGEQAYFYLHSHSSTTDERLAEVRGWVEGYLAAAVKS